MLLEFGRGVVVQGGVAAMVVEVTEVLSQLPDGFCGVGVDDQLKFGFDRSEATFHEGVVVTVASSAHVLKALPNTL